MENEETEEVVDSQGVVLCSGDSVQVIKDLPVKGTKIIIRMLRTDFLCKRT